MSKFYLMIISLILGTTLYIPKVIAKNLVNIDDVQRKSLKLIIAENENLDGIIYFHQGLNSYLFGDLPKAIKYYNQALAINPQFAEVYYQRGIVHNLMGNTQAAMKDYNQALEINSNYAGMYNQRGLLHYKLGNIQQAITDFNQALKLNAEFAEAYHHRGIAYNKLGNKQAATADLTKAAEIFKQQKRMTNYQKVIDDMK